MASDRAYCWAIGGVLTGLLFTMVLGRWAKCEVQSALLGGLFVAAATWTLGFELNPAEHPKPLVFYCWSCGKPLDPDNREDGIWRIGEKLVYAHRACAKKVEKPKRDSKPHRRWKHEERQ